MAFPIDPSDQSLTAGVYVASQYAKWSVRVFGGPVAAASPASLSLTNGFIALPDGRSFCPFAANTVISVGTGANAESVTLTSVSNCFLGAQIGTSVITGNTSNIHGQGDTVASASGGLYEAALDANNNGGGTVVVGPASGATAAQIAAVRLLYPNVVVSVLTGTVSSQNLVSTTLLTSAQLKALQTTAITLAPAPGAGYVLMARSLFLDYKYGATAYTLGNADNKIQLEYVGKSTAIINPACAGLVDQTADVLIYQAPAVALAAVTSANSANLGLEVKLAGTTPALTLGDGTVNAILRYDVNKLI